LSIQRITLILDGMENDQAEAMRRAFGEFLRQQRVARRWSQERVAHELGISQAYVGSWENAEVKRYAPSDLRAWANLYGLPVVRILLESGFLTHQDLVAADPTSYISPLIVLLGERLPPLANEDDVDLVAELAWAARHWAERHGTPKAEKAGQTTEVDIAPLGAFAGSQ
jgi:transcriptional regulator with XRE-family HTH domain